jgi:hypothetical protein
MARLSPSGGSTLVVKNYDITCLWIFRQVVSPSSDLNPNSMHSSGMQKQDGCLCLALSGDKPLDVADFVLGEVIYTLSAKTHGNLNVCFIQEGSGNLLLYSSFQLVASAELSTDRVRKGGCFFLLDVCLAVGIRGTLASKANGDLCRAHAGVLTAGSFAGTLWG